MADCAFGCEHNHTNHTAGAAIPFDSLAESTLDKVDPFLLRHSFFPVRVTVSVNVGRSGPANSICLFMKGAAEGNRVDLASVSSVVASDDNSGAIVQDESVNVTLIRVNGAYLN